MRMEGPEDSAFGAVRGFGVVDRVDKKGEADDVRKQNELLYHFSDQAIGQLRD